jgi:hypothetical protein
MSEGLVHILRCSSRPPSADDLREPLARGAARERAAGRAKHEEVSAASVDSFFVELRNRLAASVGIGALRSYTRSLSRIAAFVRERELSCSAGELRQRCLRALAAKETSAPGSEQFVASSVLSHLERFLAERGPHRPA